MANPIYDATTNNVSVVGTPANTITLSHTTASQNNRVMVVFSANAQGGNVTSMTYNGVNLTDAGIRQSASSGNFETWYLLNPSIGTHNLVINWSLNTQARLTSINTFYGVHQTGQPEDVAGSAFDGTPNPKTDTLAIGEDDCIFFFGCYCQSNPGFLDGETIVTSIDYGSAFLKVGYGFADTSTQTISANGGVQLAINGIAFSPKIGTDFDPFLLVDFI